MKSFRQLTLLVLAGALSLAAGKPAPAGWLNRVSPTATGSRVIGNPQARVKMVEYVSYTCSHCAAFEQEATGELAVSLITTGKGSLEYRPFMRNPIDVAATLLATCGNPAKFPGNQAALLRSQAKWMANISEADGRRWAGIADFGSRMKAIADDLGFYPIFASRGYARAELDSCLADEALAKRISQENQTASAVGGIDSTPSFLINDRLQDAHDWAGLRPIVQAAIR